MRLKEHEQAMVERQKNNFGYRRPKLGLSSAYTMGRVAAAMRPAAKSRAPKGKAKPGGFRRKSLPVRRAGEEETEESKEEETQEEEDADEQAEDGEEEEEDLDLGDEPFDDEEEGDEDLDLGDYVEEEDFRRVHWGEAEEFDQDALFGDEPPERSANHSLQARERGF